MADEHEKHLQLGVDLSNDSRDEISDEEKDALWEAACFDPVDPIGKFAAELAELNNAHPLEQWELARLRQERGY